jgi:hypothetical protein
MHYSGLDAAHAASSNNGLTGSRHHVLVRQAQSRHPLIDAHSPAGAGEGRNMPAPAVQATVPACTHRAACQQCDKFKAGRLNKRRSTHANMTDARFQNTRPY